VPSFPWPAWQFGPAIKPCSMKKKKIRAKQGWGQGLKW
jgi:hypothetical protein